MITRGSKQKKQGGLFLLLMILSAFFAGCSANNSSITEEVIKNSATESMRSFSYADFAQQYQSRLLNIEKITIESQQQEDGGRSVYANIVMSDALITANTYYKLLYRNSEKGWRLDKISEYREPEIEVRAKPSEDCVREYYQEKYGNLALHDYTESEGKHIYHFQYEDVHSFLTIQGTLEIVVGSAKAGKQISWTTFQEADTGRNLEWNNVEGQWCYYFSCKPETYGKSDFFSDSRYVYTIRENGGQFDYTIDRYKCEPGGSEQLNKSTRGTAEISDGKNPMLTCYNEFTSTSLCFSMDEVSQQGLGVYDKVYRID